MQRILFFIFLFASFSLSSWAQKTNKKEKKIQLQGQVIDARSKAGVEDAFITVMRADSTVVDTCHVWNFDGGDFFTRGISFYSISIPAVAGQYIIKGEHPGYQTVFTTLNIKTIGRNTDFDVPTLKMKPRKSLDNDTLQLDEVVVKATRIKMITKGDTLVYNADAFNLEEGSMLDALVRQLPGAELTSDGEIKVNGEKVEELTLNGREFFKGNNKVMLDNLPSFTVKNIQVFHKSSDKSEWAGKQVEQKTFTMDVQLKRQYNTGVLGNIEGGIGTDDRFLGRLFALRYTDCSRLSVFANMNNVNEERKPGQNGDWDPTKTQNGQMTTRMAGVDLLIDEKEHRWREEVEATFSWDKTIDETQKNAESYFSTGNNFTRSMSQSESRQKELAIGQNFMLMKPFWLMSRFNVNYGESNYTGSSRSATADASLDNWGSVQNSLDSIFAATLNPQLQARLINRTMNGSINKGSYLIGSTGNIVSFKLPNGDMFGVVLDGTATRVTSKSWTQQQVDYFRISGSDISLNKYNTQPSHSYSYDAGASYDYQATEHYSIEPGIKYEQKYTADEHNLYKLNLLDGWDVNGSHSFGELPSNRNEMLQAMDANNSYHTNELDRTPSFTLNQNYQIENDSISLWGNLSLPLNYENKRMDYYSSSLNTRVSRSNLFFEPGLYFVLYLKKPDIRFTVNGTITQNMPSLLNTVDRRNDEEPLSIQLGNPDLKNTIIEYLYFQIFKRWKGKTEFGNGIEFKVYANQRSVSQGYTYDMQTGGYTFRPVNVDGNWNMSVNDQFSMEIGSGREWHFETQPGYAFAQSVDMAAVSGESSGLNKVHTNTWTDNLRLDYKKGDLTLGLNGNVTYRHSTSDNVTFQTVNATNFAYGFTGQYLIPWLKFTVATDLKMFSRRGYSSSEFNTDDLVWNASVSKSLLKGKLIARFEAFDILHQLRNTEIVINAMGRTETFTNTIPRYAMLHLQWQFNKLPKAKTSKK